MSSKNTYKRPYSQPLKQEQFHQCCGGSLRMSTQIWMCKNQPHTQSLCIQNLGTVWTKKAYELNIHLHEQMQNAHTKWQVWEKWSIFSRRRTVNLKKVGQDGIGRVLVWYVVRVYWPILLQQRILQRISVCSLQLRGLVWYKGLQQCWELLCKQWNVGYLMYSELE